MSTRPTSPAGLALALSRVLPIVLVLGATPGPAAAWGNLLLIDPRPEAMVRSVGISVWSLPKAPGTARQDTALLPGFDWYDPSGAFVSTENGVGWNLSSSKAVQAGVRLWPQLGRGAGDDATRPSRLGTRLQQEAFVNVQALPALLLQSGLLHGSGRRRDGMQLELGATSGVPVGPDLLGIGLAATYANHAHRQAYYGVSAQDAAAGAGPATRVPNGWQDVSVTLSTEHRLSARWHVDGQFVAARLLGSAIGPVVGSRQQLAFTTSLWFDF